MIKVVSLVLLVLALTSCGQSDDPAKVYSLEQVLKVCENACVAGRPRFKAQCVSQCNYQATAE